MNKALKIIGGIFLVLIIVGNIGRFLGKSVYENSFAAQVRKANQDCPILIGNGVGQVSKIQIEDKNVTYYTNYNTLYYNLLTKTHSHEDVKEVLMMALLCMNGQGNNQGDVLIDMLISEGYGLKFILSSNGAHQFECVASVQDLKDMRSIYKANPHEVLHRLLELQMEMEKAALPMTIDEGMVMTDYGLDADNIIITITVDEDLYSISEFRNNQALIKNAMFEEAVHDNDSKVLLDMCKISHTGLVYRIVGNHSRKATGIVISSDEIREFDKTPANLNIY